MNTLPSIVNSEYLPWLSQWSGLENFTLSQALDAFDQVMSKSSKPLEVFAVGVFRFRGVGHAFIYVIDYIGEINTSTGWLTGLSSKDLQVPYACALCFCKNTRVLDKKDMAKSLRPAVFDLMESINFCYHSNFFKIADKRKEWLEYAMGDLWFANRYLGLIAFGTINGQNMTLKEFTASSKVSPFFYYCTKDYHESEERQLLGEIYMNSDQIFIVSPEMEKLLDKVIAYPQYKIFFLNLKKSPIFALSVFKKRTTRRGRAFSKEASINGVVFDIIEGLLSVDEGCEELFDQLHFTSCLVPCHKASCRREQRRQLCMHLTRLSVVDVDVKPKCSAFEFLLPSDQICRKMEEFVKNPGCGSSYPKRVLRCE